MANLKGSKQKKLYRQKKTIYSGVVHSAIYMENKKVPVPQLGTKATIMMVYAEKGKLAAWQALQEYNQKLSGAEYTLEMLEKWIGEYEAKQNQGKAKDDGCGR